MFGEHHATLVARYLPTVNRVAAAVLGAMAADGHGVATGDHNAPYRPPATRQELVPLPMVGTIRLMLNKPEGRKGDDELPASMKVFDKCLRAMSDASAERKKGL